MFIEIIGNDTETFKVELCKNPFYINKEDIEEFTDKLEELINEYRKDLF